MSADLSIMDSLLLFIPSGRVVGGLPHILFILGSVYEIFKLMIQMKLC